MSRHLYLRDDRYEALLRVREDFAHVRRRVEVRTVLLPVAAIFARDSSDAVHGRLRPDRTVLYELGEPVYRKSPALVFREVPVEHVELVVCH